jgi:hypothetical protein
MIVQADPSFVVRESGVIRFFVRPRVEVRAATTFSDVQRFALTLAPDRGALARRVALGRKRLPDMRVRERHWAYVDRVGPAAGIVDDLAASTYVTKTRGVRHQAEAVELAHGRYAIASHRDHTHVLYELDGDVDETPLLRGLRLGAGGSYIVTVFNPAAKDGRRRPGAVPDEDDVPFGEPSIFDEAPVDPFGGRRFAPLAPELLDVPGAELVMIGGAGTGEPAV